LSESQSLFGHGDERLEPAIASKIYLTDEELIVQYGLWKSVRTASQWAKILLSVLLEIKQE
jgi:hypothetical protein